MHLRTTGWINNSALIERAGGFVDFFFILSGFVIAVAYRERLHGGAATAFLMRRVGRLWPLHLATLGAAIVLWAAGSAVGLQVEGFVVSAIPANLTLTHGWGLTDRLTWNGPSWSISCEMFAYVVFALLAVSLRGKALDAACAAILLGSFIALAIVDRSFQPTYDWGVLRCLYGFMAGVLAARVWQATTFRPRGELAATSVALAAVAFLPPSLTFLLVPVFAWTVLVFASDAGSLSGALQRPLPQLLGRISYSIYMTHYLVGLVVLAGLSLVAGATAEVDGVRTIAFPNFVSDLVTLLYLAAVVGVSCISYALIEQPGRSWFNQRAERLPAAW